MLFLVNTTLLTGYSLSCHSLRHLVGGRVDCFSCSRARRVRYTLWQRLTDLNRNHMWWAWTSLITVTLADVYVRAARARGAHRPRDPLLRPAGSMAFTSEALGQIETHPFDVLVIGAGGAGLRAAIAAQAAGAKVGLVCKSLLGKAHTVMAEGGVAAALGHVDPKTSGRPTSGTRWSAASSSTTRGWPSSMRRSRPTASASSSCGAPCSTARATGGSCSGRSAATRTRASPTSATAPGSR